MVRSYILYFLWDCRNYLIPKTAEVVLVFYLFEIKNLVVWYTYSRHLKGCVVHETRLQLCSVLFIDFPDLDPSLRREIGTLICKCYALHPINFEHKHF